MSQGLPDQSGLAGLLENQAVSQLIARYANCIDRKAWDELSHCLAPELFIDYRGLRGATPETLSREAYVSKRSQLLARLSTHHLLGNVEISLHTDQGNARASCVIFLQDSSERTYNTHCLYEFDLIKHAGSWTIAAITQRVLWNEGSTDIFSTIKTGEAGY